MSDETLRAALERITDLSWDAPLSVHRRRLDEINVAARAALAASPSEPPNEPEVRVSRDVTGAKIISRFHDHEPGEGCEAATPPQPLDVEALRLAIYAVSIRHDWEHTVDREDRTEEIAAEYLTVLAAQGTHG